MLATENVPSLQAVEVHSRYMSTTKSNCFMRPAGYAWQRIELVHNPCQTSPLGGVSWFAKSFGKLDWRFGSPKLGHPETQWGIRARTARTARIQVATGTKDKDALTVKDSSSLFSLMMPIVFYSYYRDVWTCLAEFYIMLSPPGLRAQRRLLRLGQRLDGKCSTSRNFWSNKHLNISELC